MSASFLFALFTGYCIYFRLLIGSFKLFKLSEIIFGPVGIYRTVFRPFPDMYDIPDVPETEEDGGNAGNYVPTVAYDVEPLKPFAYLASQTTVHDARTAEAVAVNVVRDVGAVVYAVLVAKECKRRSVRISYDYDSPIFHIKDLLFKTIPCRFPDAQKTAVNVPPVFHFSVSLGGEIEVIPPVFRSVAVFEKNIQYIAPRLIAKGRSRFRDSLVLHFKHVAEKLQKIIQNNAP